jgi:hypothetical protein
MTKSINSYLKKYLLYIIIAILSVVLMFTYIISVQGDSNKSSSDAESSNNSSKSELITLELSKVEIADTVAKQQMGLMNREELCQDCGILFVFEKPQNLVFWMKNTYISLDIIFIDANGEILT